jgi:hypothetical protein
MNCPYRHYSLLTPNEKLILYRVLILLCSTAGQRELFVTIQYCLLVMCVSSLASYVLVPRRLTTHHREVFT